MEFKEEEIECQFKHVKRCSPSPKVKEIQIKSELLHHYFNPTDWQKLKNAENSLFWGGCMETGTLTHYRWAFTFIRLL